MSARSWAGGAVLAAAAMLVTGCVSLPDDGPVVVTRSTGNETQARAMFIDPLPPQPGDPEVAIVKGFLDAMLATPMRTDVARAFLAAEDRETWDPTNETITYADASAPVGDSRVSVTLGGADRLDARGAWQGPLGIADEELTFRVVAEDGEYRIADPPDALIVPQSWFEDRFRQVALYFFDATAQVLVPDPVFVPRGEQLASSLVRGLLAGPGRPSSSRTFLPGGVSAAPTIPVSPLGVADVVLEGDAGPPSGPSAELLAAQLAWTLRQDSSIERIRLTVGERQLEVDGSDTDFGVDGSEQFAPYVASANTLLYGLRDGLLVAGGPDELDPVTGPFGQQAAGLRTLSTDLDAERAAGVTSDGTSILLGPVRDPTGQITPLVVGATDLLRPVWDFTGRLWMVDRTANGARVSYLEDGQVRSIVVPGLTGANVRHVLVSRDAARLVAVVRRPSGDEILVSRLLSDTSGRIEEALPAMPISQEEGAGQRVRAIAWETPTSLAVLYPLGSVGSQVRTSIVDGAPGGTDGSLTRLRGEVAGLVGSPSPGVPLFALTPGVLVELSGSARGDVPVDPLITDLHYVG